MQTNRFFYHFALGGPLSQALAGPVKPGMGPLRLGMNPMCPSSMNWAISIMKWVFSVQIRHFQTNPNIYVYRMFFTSCSSGIENGPTRDHIRGEISPLSPPLAAPLTMFIQMRSFRIYKTSQNRNCTELSPVAVLIRFFYRKYAMPKSQRSGESEEST